MPKVEITPVEYKKTAFDVLMEKYQVKDPIIAKIQNIIRDYEFMKRSLKRSV